MANSPVYKYNVKIYESAWLVDDDKQIQRDSSATPDRKALPEFAQNDRALYRKRAAYKFCRWIRVMSYAANVNSSAPLCVLRG